MRSFSRQLLCWTLLVSTLFCVTALAQVAGLTPEQQRLLQQLPPAQRQALINRFVNQATPAADESTTVGAVEELPSAPDAGTFFEDSETEPATFAAGDSLVVFVTAADQSVLDPEVDRSMQLIAAGNPYRLDSRGVLPLPGTAGIPIAGLTEALTEIRLEADPLLTGLEVQVVLLPLERYGEAALQPFGYDLFEAATDGNRSSSANAPVPSSYVIGPGDAIRLQLFGAQNLIYDLTVERNGQVNVPDLGPITVAGLSFDSLRSDLVQRVQEQFIGVQASVTLTELRSIQVFLAGDVRKPGAYTISALGTVLDCLVAGGGILPSGSLRNIQLKRNGRTVSRFDLYQLLLFGDSSGNRRVADGDVIFVSPVGDQVGVTGSVNRPAIYEIRGSLDASGALRLAGGVRSPSLLTKSRVQRSNPEQGLAVKGLDLTDEAGLAFKLRAGDVLVVPGDTEQVDSAVRLLGHVYRPGLYDWREGMTLSDLIPSSREVKPEADTDYVVIERQTSPNGEIEVVSASLPDLWGNSSSARVVPLEPRDRVYVFSRTADQGRSIYLPAILNRLHRQGQSGRPSRIVRINGLVNEPGEYPLESGMTIADLLRAGGGLSESAYREAAELSRYNRIDSDASSTEILVIDLDAVMSGDRLADIELEPFDHLTVKQLARWVRQDVIEVRGEVRFPGEYPVGKGERLSSVIERAGGLTTFAFSEGSVFTRQTLREREAEQLEILANRIESDLAALALSDTAQSEAVTIGRSLLAQIEETEPAGRLVIDLDAIVGQKDGSDVFLRDGDVLYVPPRSQEVTVIGEVQYATSHLWQPGVGRDEYIDRSGGATVKADERRIYVVRANGEVVVNSRSRFFSRSRGFDIRPGDTIVVPLDTDRVKPLVLWSSATQILYNLAIAAAAVNSF